MKKNDKEPTISEIAEEIGMSKEDIVYALDAIKARYLYMIRNVEGGDSLYIIIRSVTKRTGRKLDEAISLRKPWISFPQGNTI